MSEMNEVSRSIGRIEGNLTNLSSQMKNLESDRKYHHDKMFKKFDEMNASVQTLVAELSSTREDVDEIKPKIDNLTAWKNKALGVGTIFSVLMAIVVSWIKGALNGT